MLADRVQEAISAPNAISFLHGPWRTREGFYLRLVHGAIAEAARRDLVHDARQRRALLLERHGVVHVLVAEVLDRGREVPEED